MIILNFNGGEDILACLKSLQLIKQPEKWCVEYLLVDNCSTDNSLQLIKQAFPKIKIIKNNKNLGFAGGNNVGISYALNQGADAVLLLNQDTTVEKGFLGPLIKNSADIVSPVIKFKRKGKGIYDFGGKVNWWIGRTKHKEKLEFRIKNLELDKIDYVSGCCMFIRRPVFEKIGLLDERYFLYFEDADFCLRAKKAGFKIAVEPKSLIFHKLTEGRGKPLKQRLNLLKSNLIFINRYISFWKKPIAWVYWWMLMLKVLLR
jgi:GT2 family glycosyltransferase